MKIHELLCYSQLFHYLQFRPEDQGLMIIPTHERYFEKRKANDRQSR